MDILKVRFRTNSDFEASLKPDLPNGGLFCATTAEMEPGQAVVVELNAPALPNKVLIRGTVKSWRPALPRLRVRAGAVVEFDKDEAQKRDFVLETISGDRGPAPRRRHTRLPVSVAVRYRVADSSEVNTSELSEISVGGAMLQTTSPLPIDTDIILEILPPGAAATIDISGKVTYHRPSGETGLKFIYRDAGGSRRLRELVRRLRSS
ncbi:MAG TPA: PilZ domain-containing protein [Kofleriaceae bacterium]|nr:PilZ domain-containing protein [Kofleriaceae bacterium]